MTTLFAGFCALAYLGAGFAVASCSARHEFTLSVRWWHVVFWPAIPAYFVLVTALLWMAGRNR
jgi:hypothetical protein